MFFGPSYRAYSTRFVRWDGRQGLTSGRMGWGASGKWDGGSVLRFRGANLKNYGNFALGNGASDRIRMGLNDRTGQTDSLGNRAVNIW